MRKQRNLSPQLIVTGWRTGMFWSRIAASTFTFCETCCFLHLLRQEQERLCSQTMGRKQIQIVELRREESASSASKPSSTQSFELHFSRIVRFLFRFAYNLIRNPSQVISSSLFASIKHFFGVKIRAFLHELTSFLLLFWFQDFHHVSILNASLVAVSFMFLRC